MRKLASVQRITEITAIVGKDRIELATVLCWRVIVQKNVYMVGDLAIFCEPDSVLPDKPEFDFLRSKKFRIRTMKMAGVVSQGICFPTSLLPGKCGVEGTDVTELMEIKNYEDVEEEQKTIREAVPQTNFIRNLMKNPFTRPIGRFILNRNAKLRKAAEKFPRFISKTDENRIQTLPWVLEGHDKFICREKLDGSSMTAFMIKKEPKFLPWGKDKYEFGVCSRNRQLSKGSCNSDKFLQTAEKYQLENVLKKILTLYNQPWAAIQGELVGPGVQKNRYHLDELQLYAFNLIFPNGKVHCIAAEDILAGFGIPWCPRVGEIEMPQDVDAVLKYATGPSVLNPEELREGIVCRNYDRALSFKAVSPDYLIKHDL